MELEQSIRSKLQEIGYELISINSHVDKGSKYLSIVVDRVKPIDMDAIVKLSHELNKFIDEINPFDDPYK